MGKVKIIHCHACGNQIASIAFAPVQQAPTNSVPQAEGSNTQEVNAPVSGDSAEGVSPEFKEWMDSYEAFMNDYMDLLTKYSANPTDLSILGDYASMLQKYAEYEEKISNMNEDNMSAADYKYFLESYARIMDRFAQYADTSDSLNSGNYGDMFRDLSDLYGALGQLGG